MTFEDFYKELISDTLWVELLRNYKESTIKACAQKVYDEIVTLKTLGSRTIEENRLHVYRVCKKGPEDKLACVPWHVQAAIKLADTVKEEWKPVSWEKRADYLRQVQAEIDKIDDKKIRPLFDGEAQINGQYDLPKPKAKCAPSAPIEVVEAHINKVHEARRKFYLERHPDATEEEIEEYIKKFPI